MSSLKEVQASLDFRADTFSMKWLPEEKVLFYSAVGKIEEEHMELFYQNFVELAKALHGGKIDLLCDMTGFTTISLNARKVAIKIAQHPQFQRASIYGANKFLATVATFIMMAARKSEQLKVLSTREEALDWLLQSRPS